MVKNKVVIFILILLILFSYLLFRVFSFKSFLNRINILKIKGILYSCDKGKTIKQVLNKNETTIYLDDGRKYLLKHILSASGAKYSNKDGSIIFWSKGQTAFFEDNGFITHSNCFEK